MTHTTEPTKPNTHKNSRTHSHLLVHSHTPLLAPVHHIPLHTIHTLVYPHTETHATAGLGKGERIREKGGRERKTGGRRQREIVVNGGE